MLFYFVVGGVSVTLLQNVEIWAFLASTYVHDQRKLNTVKIGNPLKLDIFCKLTILPALSI